MARSRLFVQRQRAGKEAMKTPSWPPEASYPVEWTDDEAHRPIPVRQSGDGREHLRITWIVTTMWPHSFKRSYEEALDDLAEAVEDGPKPLAGSRDEAHPPIPTQR